MANQLKMAKIQAILELHQQGWSQRRIARELLIDRETVSRYVQQAVASSKPAISPAGTDALETVPKPAISPTGSTGMELGPEELRPIVVLPGRAGRQSDCEPFRPIIVAKREQHLSAQRIYQDLVNEHGYAGGYDSVKRFVRRLGAGTPWPMRRMECAPGAEAQVDFGTGAPIVDPDGKRRKTHVFRIVLSHSRKAYSEVTHRQTTDDFLRCLENAFRHFGGVPQTIVIDNLRAAVKQPDWFDPELNPKLVSFCRHYGTVVLPTKPYTPRHKGKIERGIGYVKGNALKGRTFRSLEEQNRHLAQWETSVADRRIHGTTRQQVGHVFTTVERAALRPLPAEQFPFFHEAQRSVNRDGHVEVAKAYYSAPPEYVGRTVWVRWDSRLVRIFNERLEQLTVHARHEQGRFSTHDRHVPREKINGIERGAKWLLLQAAKIGPHTQGWAEAMFTHRGLEGLRVLQGLLSLTRRHPRETLERACEIALSYRAFRLQTLRQLIVRAAPRQELLPFLEEHPLIRPLSDYGAFVHAAIWNAPAAPVMDHERLQKFVRHDRATQSPAAEQKGPGSGDCRSLRDIDPPWSGYPSPGCSSAEPRSVSPDQFNVLPFPLPEQGTDDP